MAETFTISTNRIGPRRWWYVRIYPDLTSLRKAARRYHPSVDFSKCQGCCQAAVWRDEDGNHFRYGDRGYAGILRFAEGHTQAEIIAHELVHAAVATYRMQVTSSVQLSTTCGDQEEALAYIYGELYADFEQHFHHPLSAA